MAEQFISELFAKSDGFCEMCELAESGKFPIAAQGLSAVHSAALISAYVLKTGKKVLAVVAEESDAAKLCGDFRSIGIRGLMLPTRDMHFGSSSGTSREYEQQRLDTLSRIVEGDFDVVVAPAEAVVQSVMPYDILKNSSFVIENGGAEDIEKLCERLVSAGYERTDQVEGKGTFAKRGGILDLFCVNQPYPVRIEFWGDDVDSMSYFDPDTQRRTEQVERVIITPAAEAVYSAKTVAKAIQQYSEKNKLNDKQRRTLHSDCELLSAGMPIVADRYEAAIYPEKKTIMDYLPMASVFVLEEVAVLEKLKAAEEYARENIKVMLEEGCYFSGLSCAPVSYSCFENLISERELFFLENFPCSHKQQIAVSISFNCKRSSVWNGDASVLAGDLKPLVSSGGLAIVLAAGERAAKSLCLSLEDEGIPAQYFEVVKGLPKQGVVVTCGSLSSGFELPEQNVMVISACSETSKKRRTLRYKKDPNAKEITSLEELRCGDYVVHSAHGIGIFDGIHTITTGSITKDYIKINYAGTDVLYVPVTQLDLVSKYIGCKDDVTLKLNRLSGTEWQNTRKRVRAAVRDMAKQLTQLYARRMASKGYAFSPDTDMQSDFERRFIYDETDDQLRCINEIKDDMERPVPMDRLLCGDVGFGKTEVALRAAFKCLSEGKQCAMLVPTTILAWQHYQTILRRFAHFPINIAMLSRFSSPAEQKKIIRGLADSTVDFVVGTHRMISADVKFKDIGLVIVDEEQRFGVAQKERFKEQYPFVDVLTLSATPIPRTLNMAMSGLRDMSSLDEAPGDRYPVQTYVMEQNQAVLFEAISKEFRRGGQVYYLHNRVETIERTAARLKAAFPDASIGIAHGKMTEDALSEVWRRLMEHEIDILVCTTIIETGVDVPNVNTLIIEDADRMGLSQLHQLRGRVGRSPRRAYAYFCFRKGKSLSEVATKRLEAMREYTEFGSGFRIAMRDLEIRGAGSVLGGEQHGHLEAVGYDMYLKMLGDAMAEQKGTIKATEAECSIDIDVPAHIPESYIPALSQRLGIYRRIASIRTKEDISDVTDELCDRFGDPPEPVMGLVKVAYLRNKAAACSITEISQRNGMVLCFVNEINPESVAKMASAFGKSFYLSAGDKPYFSIKPAKGQKVLKLLEEITAVISGE